MADDQRPDQVREREWEALPELHGVAEARARRAHVGERAARGQPVVPVERDWLGAPLRLEAGGAAVRCGAAEVEAAVPCLRAVAERGPVAEHVRAEGIVRAERRGPRHL